MTDTNPRPGEIYKHFKGSLYQIVAVAKHSETGEALVVYQALYGAFQIYARPLALFLEEADIEKYPETPQKFRFERVPPQAIAEAGDGQKKLQALNEGGTRTASVKSGRPQSEQEVIMAFLDADTFEDKYNYLSSIREFLSDRLIDTLAAALDVVIPEGDLEERFSQLKICISTFRHFESNRR